MNLVFAFIAGLVFGIGILIAGMANPAKVLGFLDVFGAWDPSLGLVMAGAIAVGGMAFALAKRRSTSLLGQPINLPTNRQLDRRLIGGSLLFGVGWGIAGICPAPGVVLMGAGQFEGVFFVLAMLAGMGVYEWLATTSTPLQAKPTA